VSARVLIVNADDLGLSEGVNAGIVKAHEQGILTSASLMVRWPAAEQAADYARAGRLDLGLHVDLGEWVYSEDQWEARYRVIEEETEAAVSREVESQLARFERLLGRPPTHLDSHQHVHREEPTRSVLGRVGDRLGVPVRQAAEEIAYCGLFYGQDGRGAPVPEAITPAALIDTIESLPRGVTELACHPALAVDFESTYADERIAEVEALCDPAVRAALADAGIALRSFADFRGDAS
jgi:predicted glycoside hydrolase/deacetylase ChbG (UPF0249 family)